MVNPKYYKYTMPRLSLYRPNRTRDYQFFDRTIREMYTVGGVDMYVHKYLGPQAGGADSTLSGNFDATQPVYEDQSVLNIQDLLLLENRDRIYSTDIYTMRGVFNHQDIDFDLTQFGLFLNNDTLFITFHYNTMIDEFGRKLMNGDVLELPNLKDYHPLNSEIPLAIPRYYVIQDADFAAEGFSRTWLPHLWRVKATPLQNQQEYNDILKRPFMPENIWDNDNYYPTGTVVNYGDTYYTAQKNVAAGTDITDTTAWLPVTNPPSISDVISTRSKDYQINDDILIQAEVETPASGYDSSKFYIVPTQNSEPANPSGITADGTTTVDGTQGGMDVSPKGQGYAAGYMTGGAVAPNGLPVTPAVSFPPSPVAGDYVLRLDYKPNRLFRYDGKRWVKIEQKVRTSLDNGPLNQSLRSSFVNNTATVNTKDLGNIPSRQSLSEALKPRADNGDQGGFLPPGT
jgi:hypothetical protein